MTRLEQVETAIREYLDKYGYSPTLGEVAAAVGLCRSSVVRYRDRLAAAGVIDYEPNVPRSMKLVEQPKTFDNIKSFPSLIDEEAFLTERKTRLQHHIRMEVNRHSQRIEDVLGQASDFVAGCWKLPDDSPERGQVYEDTIRAAIDMLASMLDCTATLTKAEPEPVPQKFAERKPFDPVIRTIPRRVPELVAKSA